MHGDLLVPAVHLKLVSSQRLQDRLLVSNYDAHLFDLHGEVGVYQLNPKYHCCWIDTSTIGVHFKQAISDGLFQWSTRNGCATD